MEIHNRSDLYRRLSELVVSGLPLTNDTLNDVMAFVIKNDMDKQETINKWMKNCDTLMGKLNEAKQGL
jgi:hypothetical protein